ncbi:sigma-70 family RNA polymerase sigma factor [Desulfitibacter alkalitolerans]|uniref:sigma-70 family RNA polymerase sigma factor n=1 Tax=Desulfitibacter alkalitolerans TaxID=264641 RepID=UPI000482D80C|nr:sigma-70 family RNA polymerase sigma factor [Desulfitibacter alkalitolerans]
MAQNNLFKNFIGVDSHFLVFSLSLYGDKENQKKLNQLFQEFYFEYAFVGYLSKVLFYEAINFDKKIRIHNEKNQLILDKTINNLSKTSFLEQLTKNNNVEYIINFDSFMDNLSEKQLFLAFKKLTKHQQRILYLAYGLSLKDLEISKVLNVSQQAVSKTRNIGLKNLRRAMEATK